MFGSRETPFPVPVACDQNLGARAGRQGTKTVSGAWRLAALAEVLFCSALTPEHARDDEQQARAWSIEQPGAAPQGGEIRLPVN
jgi:hypothetical protein